ncbi:MAG: hypothetical protein ACOZJZ_01415 [Pseudomonadota bacterium]
MRSNACWSCLKQDRVDEQQAIAQLDQVLAAEREIKRAHVGLAVWLKNMLTPEQQHKLRELRATEPAPRKYVARCARLS